MTENPFVKPLNVQMVHPKRTEAGGSVVVLERVEHDVVPDYCIHGKVTCYWCSDWCWLGSETHRVVSSGDAAPMCMECATRLIPRSSVPGPIGNLHDHRRADGPHE